MPILTMRLSILFLAASAASASVIRSYVVKLPASAFPKFNTLSLEDAINGVDLLLGGNHTHSEPAGGSCPAPNTEPWQLYTPSLPAATSTDASEIGTSTFPATTSAGGDKLVTVPAISSPTYSTTVSSSAVNSSTAASTSTSATPTPTIGAGSCTNPQIRYEWNSYSTANRKKFVAAIKCLVNKPPSGNFPPATNRFEDLARLHQIYMPDVHGNPEFLVWHRYFLWTFEQLLQVECGLDIPMPWWDETKVAGDFAASDLFTNDYFGALNGPDSEGDPTCVTTGVFGSMTAHIGPGTSNIPHCLSRSWDTSETANCNTNFVNTCNSRASYTDMESCSEDGPHAYGHNGIGGVMSDVSASPSDPIFWMHHSFVDHSFYSWEQANPSIRTTTISGNDHFGNPLSMNYVLHMADIFPNITISDVMNTMSGANIGGRSFCYTYNY